MDDFQLQEYIKCTKDPVYFLNTYGHVFDIEKKQVALMTCFPYQEDCIRDFHERQNTIVLKSRQTGLSVISAGYVAWRLIFNADERILVVADNGAGAVRFLNTVRQFLDHTPEWLLPDERLVDNTKQISFSNGSWVKAVASSKNAGRGESLTMLILDETAFIEHADDIWMAAGMALTATQGKCIMISCVTDDTFVFTDKGVKQVKDFVKPEKKGGYEINEYNVFGKDKTRRSNVFFNNGNVKTKKIHTTNSFVEGSLNHKLWAFKNGKYDWYKLEDLDVGDYVSIRYGMDLWGNNDIVDGFSQTKNNKIKNVFNPSAITKDIAYLIGLYISEGNVYKKIKNNKFIGGGVTLTCGDDISEYINNAGLKFTKTKGDNLHYSINSKNFIEFLEHLGFDVSLKAKEKHIPTRILELSKDNIKALLSGIFDGDGSSRSDNGCVSISLSSKKLIEQIRMLLINFGILSMYNEGVTPPTKKVKVESKFYRLELNYKNSLDYYDKIGFCFDRKQKNRIILEDKNLHRSSPNDIIPESIDIANKIIKKSGISSYEFNKKYNLFVNSIINLKTKYKTNNISRKLLLRLIDVCKEKINKEDLEFYDKIIDENIKWVKIKKVEYSKKETFDFSLSNDKNDFWCHSVLYNGILGHQTPQGTGNLYHKTWVAAEKGEGNFHPVKIHWSGHPVLSKGLEERYTENGEKVHWSPWYQGECERLHHDSVKIAQELDLSFEGSRALVISNDVISKYEKACENIEPICYYSFDDGFVDKETSFHIWEKPVEGKNYVIGGDVARGDNKDYSTLQILDADDLVQVGEYQGKIPPDKFADLIFKVAHDYNTAYVSVEMNNMGLATGLALRNQLKYPLDKLYHCKAIKKMWAKNRDFGQVEMGEEIPGFQTTTKTRPLLINSLIKNMNEGALTINSKRLLSEFKTFIYVATRNDARAEHAPGYNDDLIFALAIALLTRETEIENVFLGKKAVKAMLDSISVSSKSFNSIDFDRSDDRPYKDDDDFNDTDWLLAPIST